MEYEFSCIKIEFPTFYTAKRQYRKLETNIIRKKCAAFSSNIHIHVYVSVLYNPTIGLPILLQEHTRTDPGNR
jgi:hypothetical protein